MVPASSVSRAAFSIDAPPFRSDPPVSSRYYDPIGRVGWLLRRLFRQVWVRATLFSLGGVLAALLAAFAGPYIPYDPSLTLASGSVDDILTILASSMLAVTTFSLSIMVSAYTAATSGNYNYLVLGRIIFHGVCPCRPSLGCRC